MVSMNRLPPSKQKAVVGCLVEGNSIRATVRMTGVAKNTIVKLLVELGAACSRYQDEHLRNLNAKRVQCDEIWSFIFAKKKNVTEEIREKHPDAGDVWTWTAIDADSKLIMSFRVGSRDAATAYDFMSDVAGRMNGRIQLSTDGFKNYLEAVEGAFGMDIDYGMVHKVYAFGSADGRHSPPECIGCTRVEVTGSPDPRHMSTSYVERANLTMRMSMRRFTRLTNAFSRKVENHAAMVALTLCFATSAEYIRRLRVTSAMASGVSDHVWDTEEIIALLG